MLDKLADLLILGFVSTFVRKMKKPKIFDRFLYRHFKNNGHSPSKLVIQRVENNIYDPNSPSRFKKKNIKRHETEQKWIKFLQSHFPLLARS